MVGLRAKVLGQMGWTTSPYLRAGALSCPSLAIYGPGSYGAPAFILSSAALWETPLGRGLRSCALSALRGTVGGATMTTPGGAGTHWQSSSPVPALPASLIRPELPPHRDSGPSL